ncbi:hypothetical protein FKZ61_008970 [Litorilinea aerophila]|uniref:Vgb family protein n=1 Tax=Litorilinea aerophila TaxID=1204385 RepID=UPI000B765CCF|nr:hypothetical protein [Litorilinea aerophila]MCC9076240.1 hypothetical protein [Litorilinea aerophila]OUC05177.1 hypothetical protein RY27_28825 [Litorilinea aerophila]
MWCCLLVTLALAWGVAPARAELTATNFGLRIEYPIPNKALHVVIQAPGQLWFTAPEANAVGKLTVLSGPNDPLVTYTISYVLLDPGSEPFGLVYHDDAVWFTQRGANKLGRIDVNSQALTEYAIPTPNSEPMGIARAPDGTLWFTQRGANQLGRFDPTTQTFQAYPLPGNLFTTTEPRLREILVKNNNEIWFTAPGAGAVGNYRVDTDQFFAVYTLGQARPMDLVLDSSGRLWTTQFEQNALAAYAPGTLSLWTPYPVTTPNSGPVGILFRNNGATWDFWFTENQSGLAGRLTIRPNGQFVKLQEFPLGQGSAPWDIVMDSNNHVWITDQGRNVIIELRPPYLNAIYMPWIARQ